MDKFKHERTIPIFQHYTVKGTEITVVANLRVTVDKDGQAVEQRQTDNWTFSIGETLYTLLPEQMKELRYVVDSCLKGAEMDFGGKVSSVNEKVDSDRGPNYDYISGYENG
jgi:hypothetical protein